MVSACLFSVEHLQSPLLNNAGLTRYFLEVIPPLFHEIMTISLGRNRILRGSNCSLSIRYILAVMLMQGNSLSNPSVTDPLVGVYTSHILFLLLRI